MDGIRNMWMEFAMCFFVNTAPRKTETFQLGENVLFFQKASTTNPSPPVFCAVEFSKNNGFFDSFPPEASDLLLEPMCLGDLQFWSGPLLVVAPGKQKWPNLWSPAFLCGRGDLISGTLEIGKFFFLRL